MTNPRIVIVHPGKYLQCRTYAIAGPSGAILVDPGSGYYDEEVIAGLREHGIAPDDVKAVLLTHYHVDHALGIGLWQERGASLLASLPTATGLRTASPMIWMEHPELLRGIDIDDVLVDGQSLALAGSSVECVATPGHTAGCMTYVVVSANMRAAFTGDLLMPNCHPGWAGDECFSSDALLESIRRLQTLGLTQAFPGHGSIDMSVGDWLSTGETLGRLGQWNIGGGLNSVDLPERGQG